VIDPNTNRIVAQIPVGSAPTRVALTDDSLWVVNTGDDTLSRIDTRRRVETRVVPLPGTPSAVAADGSSVWVVYLRSLDAGTSGVGSAGAALIDPRFDDVTSTVSLNRLFEYEDAVAIGAGGVWAADPGFVTRLEPHAGRILRVVPVGYSSTDSIAVGRGAVWAIGGTGIARIDPARNAPVITIPVAQSVNGDGPSPTAIAVNDNAVWVATRFIVGNAFRQAKESGSVSRIDPRTNAVVARVTVGHDPSRSRPRTTQSG
jgi:hypothetical protein